MASPRNKAANQQQKTVSFRLPEDLMAKLRALAKQNRRTLSGELQMAIEEHLRREATPKGAANTDGQA